MGKFIDDAALKETDDELIGLIAPHAGYVYSGHVAGIRLQTVGGAVIRHGGAPRVKPSLPNRHGAAIYARGAFRTPLGDIQIDEDLASEITRLNSDIVDLPPAHVKRA